MKPTKFISEALGLRLCPKFILLSLLILLSIPVCAQISQTVTGVVTDKISKQPLLGATVYIQDAEPPIGTVTDESGDFVLKNVPLGRQIIRCEYLGYTTFVSEGMMITSQRQEYMEIALEPGGINLGEVVVEAGARVNRPINEASTVSTRSFSADETDRIAASVNDPGRLALAYPGVAQGPDDNENDIIIRGNAPFGLSWRLEGIDIPNPNHFARPGSSGGGVTVFSSQLLSRSDFSTGGMPAEYGNTLSGVMDVHFRKGNKLVRQHKFKVGMLGIDLSTEGPIQSNKSSYLVNYRYSTLGILTNLGIYLVGERVTNEFQDLSFNIAFDGNDKNKFTLFGLGGLSQEHYNPVTNVNERDPTRASHWEDRIRDHNMGAIGGTYTRYINDVSYLKFGLALMGREIDFYYDVLDAQDNRVNYHDERHEEARVSSSALYSIKLGTQSRFKTGMFYHYIPNYSFYKKTIARRNISDVITENTDLALDGTGSTSTFQYFAQISHDITRRFTVNAGAHWMYFPLNQTSSLEPRISLKYLTRSRHKFSIAYGLYSKILPLASYFIVKTDTINNQYNNSYPNLDLPMVKAHHLIGSYDYVLSNGLKFSAELYYQYLFNVPINPDEMNLYWMLNFRTYPNDEVISEGTGNNYGVDLAVEKFFATKVYFLLTGSIFRSKFNPGNNREFPSTFANQFVSSLTVGREFAFKKNRVLQVGSRVLWNGGNRYTPLNVEASLEQGRYIGDINLTNAEQIPNYFRVDARIAYRYNAPKLSGGISLDIQNLTNRSNPNGVWYSADLNELGLRYHSSGLVPVLSFQFDL